MKLPKKLYEAAIDEVTESLIADLGNAFSGDKDTLRETAIESLDLRIEQIIDGNRAFEKRMRKATVKAHEKSLRTGHIKGLRDQLQVQPGKISRTTAKKITDYLFE